MNDTIEADQATPEAAAPPPPHEPLRDSPYIPPHEPPDLQQAEDLLRQGRADEAFAWFDTMLTAGEQVGATDEEAVRTAYGIALATAGQPRRALTHFLRAAELVPGAPQFRNVGVAYQSLGDHSSALDAFRQAIRADNAYADGHRLLAQALLDDGRTADGVEALQAWLRLHPGQPDALLTYARTLASAGCFADAAVFLEQAARTAQVRTEGLERELGLLHLQAGQSAAAERCLEAALAHNPHDVHAHAFLAVLSEQQGRRPDALAQFELAQLFHRCRPGRWPESLQRELARLALLAENYADGRVKSSTAAHLSAADLPAADTPAGGKLITVLVGCYGDFPAYSVRCLNSVLNAAGITDTCDVLIGLNACSDETTATAEHAVARGAAAGLVRSTRNLNKDPMMRLLLDQVQTPYVLWLDDDSHMTDPSWPAALAAFIRAEHPFDVAGQLARWGPRRDLDPAYMRFIRARPWWTSEAHYPQDLREWAPFVVGGLFIARTAYLRRHDFPDRGMTKAMDDVALGELVLQTGGRLLSLPADLLAGARISDGHRRGENFELPPESAAGSARSTGAV